jgi:drug/metabolite transporter (DMT)-like permease
VRTQDWGRLLGLAAIWSLQYLLLRLAVPVFGTAPVAEARAVFGALVVVPMALALGQRIAFREHWREYVIVCLPNNVLPFACFAWAATVLPAGYLAIIGGTTPLFAGLFAHWALGEPLGARRIAGFAMGVAGVALIVRLGPVALDARAVLGTLVAVLGSASWGWGGIVIKQRSAQMPPIGMAAGSITAAALLMLPLLAFTPAPAAWTVESSVAVVGLGVLCSGLAYLFFFTLIRDIGPARTLTTGLMVPVLGVLWGWLFLDEAVTLAMLAGSVLVIGALAFVLRR